MTAHTIDTDGEASLKGQLAPFMRKAYLHGYDEYDGAIVADKNAAWEASVLFVDEPHRYDRATIESLARQAEATTGCDIGMIRENLTIEVGRGAFKAALGIEPTVLSED